MNMKINWSIVLEGVVVALKGFGLVGAAVAVAYKSGASQWASEPEGVPVAQLSLIHWSMFEAGCVALVTFLSTSFGNILKRFNGNQAPEPPHPIPQPDAKA